MTCVACCKYSRIGSVTRPKPILVKKLMENRVLRGWSRGNMCSKYPCIDGSRKRAASAGRPSSDCISFMRILIKIREEDVVSSSFMYTTSKLAQLMLSVASSAPKKRAMLRSLFVSYRWIVS